MKPCNSKIFIFSSYNARINFTCFRFSNFMWDSCKKPIMWFLIIYLLIYNRKLIVLFSFFEINVQHTRKVINAWLISSHARTHNWVLVGHERKLLQFISIISKIKFHFFFCLTIISLFAFISNYFLLLFILFDLSIKYKLPIYVLKRIPKKKPINITPMLNKQIKSPKNFPWFINKNYNYYYYIWHKFFQFGLWMSQHLMSL